MDIINRKPIRIAIKQLRTINFDITTYEEKETINRIVRELNELLG